MDVSTIVTQLNGLVASTGPIPLIGLAVLGIAVGIKLVKWVRRAL